MTAMLSKVSVTRHLVVDLIVFFSFSSSSFPTSLIPLEWCDNDDGEGKYNEAICNMVDE